MNLLRCWIREWMVGWHQGRKERHEREIRRHAAAETHWRRRRDECTHGTARCDRQHGHPTDTESETP